MKHKKDKHPNKVSICQKYKEHYTCRFGEHCWFKHEKNMEDISMENSETTEKIFNILEKFTERMLIIESQVKINKSQ